MLRAIKRALDDIRKGGYRDYADVETFRSELESKA